jgi:hypothetical protein
VQEGRSLADKFASLITSTTRTVRDSSPLQVPDRARFQSSPPIQLSFEEQRRIARSSTEHLRPKYAQYDARYRGSSWSSANSTRGTRRTGFRHIRRRFARRRSILPGFYLQLLRTIYHRLARSTPYTSSLQSLFVQSKEKVFRIWEGRLLVLVTTLSKKGIVRDVSIMLYTIYRDKNHQGTTSLSCFFKTGRDPCRTKKKRKESRVIWEKQLRTSQNKRFSIVQQAKTGEG